jgi:IS605 OrfB family transposase
VPFNGQTVQLHGDKITYNKQTFRFWKSRDLPVDSKIKTGSFNQDARGRWYLNLQVEFELAPTFSGNKEAGGDQGLKHLMKLSDGTTFDRENLTKQYEDRLAKAQRAKKKGLTRSIHAKIKNKREDFNQKTSTYLCRTYYRLAIGGVNSSALMKTKMAKSVADASWTRMNELLVYKAITHGTELCLGVNEAYTTQECHVCKERTGPKGLGELGVREWTCEVCGSRHERDQNAAINIFVKAFGRKPRSDLLDEQGQMSLFGLAPSDADGVAGLLETNGLEACEKKAGTAEACRSGH